MRNIAFVIWMLGWPFLYTIDNFVSECLLKRTYPNSTDHMATLFMFIIWFVVGMLTYEKREKK